MTSGPHGNMMMQAESFTEMFNNEPVRQQIRDEIISGTCNGKIKIVNIVKLHYVESDTIL